MSGVEIREADESDLPEVLRLYALPDFDDGHALRLQDAVERLRQMRSYPDYRLYVALIDGRIVGTFTLLIAEKILHMGAKAAIVDDVIVDTLCRGRAIGKAMMAAAMDMARARGCYKLALSTNAKRIEAHRFYESLGFARHGYSYVIELANSS
ncbi:MAG: GNAT family N-acetyltransferase [Planctomycetia bacterium]|nr:GNAT family N-acetyltransferase [Planctomycetia bacterium]